MSTRQYLSAAMRLNVVTGLLGLGALLLAGTASAAVIFDNGGPSDVAGPVVSDEASGNMAAGDFVLSPGQDVIRDIHWWGIYQQDAYDDDFTIRVHSDDAGVPGGVVAERTSVNAIRSLTGFTWDDGESYPIYSYDLLLGIPIDLDPGTTYWLSILNSAPSSPQAWKWLLSSTGDGATGAFFSGSNWNAVGFEPAFNLTNDVPVPATLALLAIGGLLMARRGAGRQARLRA